MDGNGLIKKLRPADILLVSERGLKHSINRALGRSKWHHVMLYIGQGRVVEVTPRKGCHISKLDLARDCYVGYMALRHKKIVAAEKKKIVTAAVKLFLGKKFSWRQLAKVFFRRLLEFKGNKNSANMPDCRNGAKSLICSNLVSITYQMAGRSISDRWAPDYIMPRDYAKLKELEIILEKRADGKV